MSNEILYVLTGDEESVATVEPILRSICLKVQRDMTKYSLRVLVDIQNIELFNDTLDQIDWVSIHVIVIAYEKDTPLLTFLSRKGELLKRCTAKTTIRVGFIDRSPGNLMSWETVQGGVNEIMISYFDKPITRQNIFDCAKLLRLCGFETNAKFI